MPPHGSKKHLGTKNGLRSINGYSILVVLSELYVRCGMFIKQSRWMKEPE
jgi:hypothetical protein